MATLRPSCYFVSTLQVLVGMPGKSRQPVARGLRSEGALRRGRAQPLDRHARGQQPRDPPDELRRGVPGLLPRGAPHEPRLCPELGTREGHDRSRRLRGQVRRHRRHPRRRGHRDERETDFVYTYSYFDCFPQFSFLLVKNYTSTSVSSAKFEKKHDTSVFWLSRHWLTVGRFTLS